MTDQTRIACHLCAPPENRPKPILDARAPDALVAQFRAGGVILLCCRASADRGSEVWRAAVEATYDAAQRAVEPGCDIPPLLPDAGRPR